MLPDTSSVQPEQLTTKTAAVVALLATAVRDFSPVAFANSLGAEDMVLTDIIWRKQLEIDIFSLDTGRLPAETYDLITRAERHYRRRIKIIFPHPADVEACVRHYGINGFYDSIEARKACCHARKVAPLERALAGKRAWITGLRATQAMTREGLQPIAPDPQHGIAKISPLADWSEAEVWAYLRAHDVPYNALHEQNYPSIGCAPCTRAIAPGEDIRAGRWWWENPQTKECGLHLVDGRLQRIKKEETPV
ncbi:MAG: phosphoadenylyl-sulfate reductase [Betaproteobacteria bacterium HGW-Betaproteobacteria-11]|nr:MAG: phosphoadenylyl-sulfate reductase [Betaproteobacteria bacterium HGW-Betaproteobacteria-11]